jgi:hypothetical protein
MLDKFFLLCYNISTKKQERYKKMWLSKNFKTYGEAIKFKADMIWKGYKVELYFITNGYCVEYKKLALVR